MAERERQAVGQPELRSGVMVATDTGMEGMVTEFLEDFPDAEGGVRVAWAGANTTVVPRRAITVMDGRFIVRTDGSRSAPGTTDEIAAGEDVVVPVIEERLVAETPWKAAGTVHLRLRTEEAAQTVGAEIAREDLEIAEVEIGRVLAAGESPAPRQEGDTLVIPVVEERLVVAKERVLAREVRMTKRTATEHREVTDTVRRQRVEIAGDAPADRIHDHGTNVDD